MWAANRSGRLNLFRRWRPVTRASVNRGNTTLLLFPGRSPVFRMEDDSPLSNYPAMRAIDKIHRSEQEVGSALLFFPTLSSIGGMENFPQAAYYPSFLFEEGNPMQVDRETRQFFLS